MTPIAVTAVRPARPSEIDTLVGVLTRAFDRDPALNWILRKDGKRQSGFNLFFNACLRELSMPFGDVYTTDDLRGAALWVPPGKWKLGILREMVLGPTMVRAMGLSG